MPAQMAFYTHSFNPSDAIVDVESISAKIVATNDSIVILLIRLNH